MSEKGELTGWQIAGIVFVVAIAMPALIWLWDATQPAYKIHRRQLREPLKIISETKEGRLMVSRAQLRSGQYFVVWEPKEEE